MDQQPVTKQDLAALETRMDAKFVALEERIDAKLKSFTQDLMEFSRGLQTELLRGFETYARGNDIRLRNLEVNTSNDSLALKQRVAELEGRVLQVEKRLILEPPPA